MRSNILDILNEIGSDTKRSHKLAIIEREKDNELFMRVVLLALCPFTQFYIRIVPEYSSTDSKTLEWALDELSKLSSRQLTGHAGVAHLSSILTSLHADDAIVIERIIGKDLRCGAADGTVNAIVKDYIPTYPCLLAKPYDEKNLKKITFPALSQTKADGGRVNLHVDGNSVLVCGRSGKEIFLKNHLDAAFIALCATYDCPQVFDGELVVVDAEGKLLPRRIGNGIINKAIQNKISDEEASMVRVQLWDAIPLSEFKSGKSTQDYKTRFDLLLSAIDRAKPTGTDATYAVLAGLSEKYSSIPCRIVHTLDEARAHFNELLAAGEEGTILKNYKNLWADTRSPDLVKFKAELTCEMEIIGHNPGEGKFLGLVGSLICASSDRKVECAISGIPDDLRQWITANITQLMGKIVTVKYNERISSQSANRANVDSLFLPRFECFRDDKLIADSSDEIPIK